MAGNRGMLQGSGANQWKNFSSRLDCWPNTGFGASTPPTLGTGGWNVGRYLYMPAQRLCMYNFSIVFGNSGQAAGGGSQNALAGNYLMELPIPARTFDDNGAQSGNYSVAVGDRQVGNGWVGQGNGAINGTPVYPQIAVVYTIADYPGVTYGGPSTKWFQAFVPYVLAGGNFGSGGGVATTFQGTAGPLSGLGTFTLPATPASLGLPSSAVQSSSQTIMCSDGLHYIGWTGTSGSTLTGCTYSGSSSATVAVGAQLLTNSLTIPTTASTMAVTFPYAMTTAPMPGDITITFTSSDTKATTQVGEHWITSISNTGFTLNITATPTTATTFTYKVRTDLVALMNGGAPFNVGATPFDAIRGHLFYETAY